MNAAKSDHKARWLVYAGLFALSLAFHMPGHFPPWASFQSEWMACLGVCLVLLGGGRPHDGLIAVPPLALVMAVSALVPSLQVWAGLVAFVSDGLIPTLYGLGAALAVSVSAGLAGRWRSRWAQALLLALLVSATIAAGLAISQWLQLPSRSLWMTSVPPGGRPFANLGQPNHLATLLLLGLVGAVHAYEHRRLQTPALVLLVAWLGVALVATQSRTGLVSLVLLALWWSRVGQRFQARLRPLGMAGGVTCLLMLAATWEPLTQRLLLDHAQPLADRLAPGPRLAIWLQAFDASLLKPWLGFGWNQAAQAQLAVAAMHPDLGRPWDSAHNLVLDLALAAGWPLAVAWSLGLTAWIWRKSQGAQDIDAAALVGALGAIGVHALLEYPLAYAYFLAPAALLAGALETTPRQLTWPRAGHAAVVVACLAMLVWLGTEYLGIEQAHQQIRLSQQPFAQGHRAPLPTDRVSLLDAPAELQHLMQTQAAPGMSAQAVERLRVAAWRYPMPPALMRLATAQGLNDQGSAAALTLRQLCALHPPRRCEEARAAWQNLLERYPTLPPFPARPSTR